MYKINLTSMRFTYLSDIELLVVTSPIVLSRALVCICELEKHLAYGMKIYKRILYIKHIFYQFI